MNCYCEKERWASVPILCRITLQNTPYMDYNLLVLTSLEVTQVLLWLLLLWILKSPACCDNSHLLVLNKVYRWTLFQSAKFKRMGLTNVWQFDAPSRCCCKVLTSSWWYIIDAIFTLIHGLVRLQHEHWELLYVVCSSEQQHLVIYQTDKAGNFTNCFWNIWHFKSPVILLGAHHLSYLWENTSIPPW